MNEWKATKVHVYVQYFSLSLQAWEDLLKFDTTARIKTTANLSYDQKRWHFSDHTNLSLLAAL